MFLKSRRGNDIKKTVIKIPSESKNIRKVSSRLLNSLSAHLLDSDRAFDVRLCTEEAVRNAIVHGNRSDKRRSVKMTYWIDDDKITIEIEDEGSGFDPKGLPDPTLGENVMRNCGRGVYLIRQLMDFVQFNERGNKITMVKNLK